MYSLDELIAQNKDITDLCDILTVLIEHPELHGNPYLLDLLQRFREKVWMHLVFEDNTVYAELARHDDETIRTTARQFHDSAREIKHCFNHYIRHATQPAKKPQESQALIEECRDIFGKVRERIEYENEHMFPLVRKYQNG